MSQDSSPQIEIERAAEIAIANAKERREKAGWGGDDAHAKIESLLSAEDIAQVNVQVQAELERIERDMQTSMAQSATSGSTATQARRSRQMI